MTKISNEVAYVSEQPISQNDYVIGTDGDSSTLRTKSFTFANIRAFVNAGLNPVLGGTLAINQIVYTGVLTTPEEVVNQLVPNIEIAQYEVLIISVNDVLYLTKVQDRIVGDTQPPVSASDFISLTSIFTVTVPDATGSVKGILKLTGDLGGTADAPTTPTAVHKTGNESITGIKTFFPSTSGTQGLVAYSNVANAPAFYASNTSTQSGSLIQTLNLTILDGTKGAVHFRNTTTQNNLVLNATGGSTGKPLSIQTNDVENSFIDYLGNFNATSFVKIGGTASQFLKADGSVSLIDGSETKITNGTNSTVAGNGTIATPYQINVVSPDGSETKLTAGSGIGITGTGTTPTPYIIESVKTQKILTYPTDFPSNNYTLTSADNDSVIYIENGANAVTITVPTGLTAKFEAGFIQVGTADVTYLASGTTVTNPVGLKNKGAGYNTFLIQKGSTGIFNLLGNTKA